MDVVLNPDLFVISKSQFLDSKCITLYIYCMKKCVLLSQVDKKLEKCINEVVVNDK